jgi:small conductance mechanosensitive channel
MQKTHTDETLVGFLRAVLYGFSLIFVFVAALDRLGVNTTSFAAAIAAAGLAVGVALQGTTSNFAAGVMIIMFHYFRVGDRIEVAGHVGTVKEIEMLYTMLSNDDKVQIIVPNNLITSGAVKVFPRPA